MARVATVTGVLLFAVIHAAMSVTIQEFYPDTKTNLTKVKWSHATNTMDLLEKALNSSDVMMIEADVIAVKKESPEGGYVAMMGHSLANTSTLSLADFIKKVTPDKKKGIKLDFKTIEAFNAGVSDIAQNLSVPIWLNADILKGPTNSSNEPPAVDAKSFIEGANKLPQTLLSLGWTTSYDKSNQNGPNDTYSKEHVEKMVDYVNKMTTNQSVTYPVRACYAVNDAEGLKNLLTKTISKNPTLTIWSAKDDNVDAVKLDQLIKTIGVDKVYVDVPATLWEQLNLGNGAFTVKSSLTVLFASLVTGLWAVKLL